MNTERQVVQEGLTNIAGPVARSNFEPICMTARYWETNKKKGASVSMRPAKVVQFVVRLVRGFHRSGRVVYLLLSKHGRLNQGLLVYTRDVLLDCSRAARFYKVAVCIGPD
jgi:hypothetical protein